MAESRNVSTWRKVAGKCGLKEHIIRIPIGTWWPAFKFLLFLESFGGAFR